MNRKEFCENLRRRGYLDDMHAIAGYCRRQWPRRSDYILRIADEICRHEFIFDMKWDMDRVQKSVKFGEKVQWDYMPGNDPEFVFLFNRHRYFITLGQAYAMTRDEKYARTYVELMTDWIEKMPCNEENRWHTWRTIEAGLRGEYWMKAVLYFIDSPCLTDEVIKIFCECMNTHADYLIEHHDKLRRMSNWSIMEDHGLFEIGCILPQTEQTREYIRIALDHLTVEARLQILPDGTQWEQSPMYHNEVLHCFQDVLLLCKKNRIPVPEALNLAVNKMTEANCFWQKPDGHQFMNGDSDDNDIREIQLVSSYLYSDPVMKHFSLPEVDYDSAWMLGIQGIQEYEQQSSKLPEFTSCALADSGNYYLRSGWDPDASLLHFHCGTIGAGHGHSDQLHFDLYAHGEDILTDSGRYTYSFGPERCEFKDPTAHNTITVDGEFFTVCKDSWECSKLAAPVNQKYRFGTAFEYVQGGHLGYMDLPNGVAVNRKIVFIKPDIYLVFDEMYTGGEHSYEQYFHFSERGTVTLSGTRAVYQGVQADAELIFITGEEPYERTENVKTTGAGAGEFKVFLEKSRIARDYNCAKQRDCIRTAFHGNGFCSTITCICTAKRGSLSDDFSVKKVPVHSVFRKVTHPDSWAEAVSIRTEGKRYTVIVCHQEVNTPTDQTEADGCMGFGQVIVFDKSVETQVGTVLVY